MGVNPFRAAQAAADRCAINVPPPRIHPVNASMSFSEKNPRFPDTRTRTS